MGFLLTEQETQIYGDALVHARRLRDEPTASLFENLLQDERAHFDKLAGTTSGSTHHG